MPNPASWPKISVVTPCFNSEHTIRETIESVRDQGYPNIEHIVMDGGSTDGTLKILREYPHLKLVSEKDEGHYHAMNKGIQAATGEIIEILNSDDCLRPGALQLVGQSFADHPDWDGLFGDVVFVDGENREIFRREEAVWDYNILRYSGVGYVIHPAFFVRKSVHDRLGLYRHKDYLNCCDGDLYLRIGRAGYRIGHVNALLINYRYHQFGQSADLRVTRNMHREWDQIRKEHGAPMGRLGGLYKVIYKAKRQFQKLTYRGKVDLVSGKRILRRVMQAQTSFTSNIDMSKLDQPKK